MGLYVFVIFYNFVDFVFGRQIKVLFADLIKKLYLHTFSSKWKIFLFTLQERELGSSKIFSQSKEFQWNSPHFLTWLFLFTWLKSTPVQVNLIVEFYARVKMWKSRVSQKPTRVWKFLDPSDPWDSKWIISSIANNNYSLSERAKYQFFKYFLYLRIYEHQNDDYFHKEILVLSNVVPDRVYLFSDSK